MIIFQVPVNPGALPAVKIEVVLKDARKDFRMYAIA